MGQGLFITGTDTGVGKTRCTILIMNALKNAGYSVVGMKPIASGAEWDNGQLKNDDASLIRNNCSKIIEYELVNPVVFELPVAPHIAAKLSNQQIDLKKIKAAYDTLKKNNDFVVVEGVGGWRVPISKNQSLNDLVKQLGLSVLLVVGLRLGCINHAILTSEAISSDGVKLCGWISCKLDEAYPCTEETIRTLKTKIPAPLITEIPFSKTFILDEARTKIDLSVISQCLPAHM